jgi:hypothetical protein
MQASHGESLVKQDSNRNFSSIFYRFCNFGTIKTDDNGKRLQIAPIEGPDGAKVAESIKY